MTWAVVNRKAGNRTASTLVNTETWWQVASFDDWTMAEAVAAILNQVGSGVLADEMATASQTEPF